MKKVIALLLCVLSMAALAACGSAGKDSPSKPSSDVQIPSPFVDCDTLDDAAAISGFDMSVPDTISGYSERTIQAVADDMIQVFYLNGDDKICVRKAVGAEDISGDYNEYAETTNASVGELQVCMKGNDGTVHVATWTADGFAYAISVDGNGLAADEVSALVSAVS